MSIILHYLAEKLLLYSNNFKTECYVGGTLFSKIALKNIFQKIEFIILKMGRGNAIISSKYIVGQ